MLTSTLVAFTKTPREVNTKFSKTFTTDFFPVGKEIIQIVAEWTTYLREGKLWGNDDPLFPATNIALNSSRQFEAAGLKREHWRSAAPIRRIFRDAFRQAGLQYFHPHSFRDTLGHLGETVCQTPEQFKAWSQSLGHEHVLTTFLSYGEVSTRRQGEIFSTSEITPAFDANRCGENRKSGCRPITKLKTRSVTSSELKRVEESWPCPSMMLSNRGTAL